MGNRIIGEIVGRLEEQDIEHLVEQVDSKHLREKFVRIFKYMMKDNCLVAVCANAVFTPFIYNTLPRTNISHLYPYFYL